MSDKEIINALKIAIKQQAIKTAEYYCLFTGNPDFKRYQRKDWDELLVDEARAVLVELKEIEP